RVAPRVLFVRQLNDRDERVRTEEVVTHLDERRVDAVVRRGRRVVRRIHLDRVPGIRLNEEVVPALELSLETAAVLLHAFEARLEVSDELSLLTVAVRRHVRR